MRQQEIMSNFDNCPEPDNNQGPLQVIRSGFDVFDNYICGIGGIPRSRITQLYGAESVGKTLTAMRLAAMAQMDYPDETVVWLDVEKTFDFDWAVKQGICVDSDVFRYHTISSVESCADHVARYLTSGGGISLLVIDSIGQLANSNQLGGDAFARHEKGKRKDEPINAKRVAGVAGVITDMTKNITANLDKSNAAVLGINQIRDKIGVVYGDPIDFPGGHLWKHNIALNIQVLRRNNIEDDRGEVEVYVAAYYCRKNKCGVSGHKTDESVNAHPRYYLEDGINKAAVYSAYDAAVRLGIIENNRGRIDWDGVKWHGKDAIIEDLLNDEDLVSDLQAQVSNFGKKKEKQKKGLLGRL